MKLYGIKTCDTCRKALKELAAAGQEVSFVDVRAEPVPKDRLAAWFDALGADLVNRRSTTWKGLDAGARAGADEAGGVVQLLGEHPTLMKRPVIETADGVYLGWNAETKAALGL